jgi:hypothetical protein
MLNLPIISHITTASTGISHLNYEDPFFQGMFEKKNESLRMPKLKKAFRVSSSGNSSFYPLISTENGSPLFLRSGGTLNVFLFCSSLESDFGNFTSNALFPSILLRIGEMSQRKAPIALTIGKEAFYPLYKKSQTETPVHIKNKKSDFIPRVEKMGLVSFISLNGQEALELLNAGNYDIIDDRPQAPLSLNYDRSESVVEHMSITELTKLFKDQGLTRVSANELINGHSATDIDVQKPFEYWWWLVALSLLFLFTELALLKFWK